MNVTELIGQRALLQTVAKGYSSARLIDEYIILEVSPSGNWVKLQRVLHGAKFWTPVTDVALVEVLKPLKQDKPKE